MRELWAGPGPGLGQGVCVVGVDGLSFAPAGGAAASVALLFL